MDFRDGASGDIRGLRRGGGYGAGTAAQAPERSGRVRVRKREPRDRGGAPAGPATSRSHQFRTTEKVTFVCWKWKPTALYRHHFTAEHVNIWARSLRRCLHGADARLICITDDSEGIEIETHPLWGDHSELSNPNGKHLPSCYRRLRLFGREALAELGIPDGAAVAWSDLDVVFVGDVRPMFYERQVPFVGWKGVGAYNDDVFNGTFVLFRAGQVDYLWREFDPVKTPKIVSAAKYFGSDQAWLSYRMASSHPGWGVRDGVYSFSRDILPLRNGLLPRGARVVSFNGKWKPWDEAIMSQQPWIKDHWR